MIKITASYESKEEKEKIIKAISKGIRIKHIKEKQGSKYNKLYIEID